MLEGKKIFGLALLGAVVYYVLKGNPPAGNSKSKNKTKNVDILLSIKRTFVNEGTWVAEDSHQAKDIGNYYPTSPTAKNRIYYGTNFGITAAFLVEHYQRLGIPLADKNVIKNLTSDQAKEIYQTVIGARMRYDEFKNQFVADFIFDWMIQRPSTCIAYMTEKIFSWGLAEKKAEIDRGQFSDKLLDLINSSDPERLYNSLKFWRLYHLTYTETYKSFRKGVFNRIAKYKDFKDSPDVAKLLIIAKAKAFQTLK